MLQQLHAQEAAPRQYASPSMPGVWAAASRMPQLLHTLKALLYLAAYSLLFTHCGMMSVDAAVLRPNLYFGTRTRTRAPVHFTNAHRY